MTLPAPNTILRIFNLRTKGGAPIGVGICEIRGVSFIPSAVFDTMISSRIARLLPQQTFLSTRVIRNHRLFHQTSFAMSQVLKSNVKLALIQLASGLPPQWFLSSPKADAA